MQKGSIRKYLVIGLAIVLIVLVVVMISHFSSAVSEMKPVIVRNSCKMEQTGMWEQRMPAELLGQLPKQKWPT